MKPPIPLLDPRFKYVPSHQTDIEKTFERARQELARQKAGIPAANQNEKEKAA